MRARRAITASGALASVVMWLKNLVLRLWREGAKFGLVGLFNFLVDAGLYLFLRRHGMQGKVITAGIVSSSVAATSSYFMNRHWTWRDKTRSGLQRELPLFLVLSGVGIAISNACVAVSHYVLGFHSLGADSIAKNGFGLVLGMVFRFWSFKKWVFLSPPSEPEPTALEDAVRTTV